MGDSEETDVRAVKEGCILNDVSLRTIIASSKFRDYEKEMARELLRARSALADVGECETCNGQRTVQGPAVPGLFNLLGPHYQSLPCPSCTGKQPRPAAKGLPTSHDIAQAAISACDRPRQLVSIADGLSFRDGFREGANWLYDRVSPAAEVKFKPTLSAEEHCKMFCAWKGGDPCRADDCPRRPAAHNAQDRDYFDPVWLGMLYIAADSVAPVHRGAVMRAYEYIKRRLASTAERE